MDDKKVPFHRTYGIIVLEGDMSDTRAYINSILQVFDLIPYGEIYLGMKIRLSPSQAVFRFIDSDGQLTVLQFKTARGELYHWVDEGEASRS